MPLVTADVRQPIRTVIVQQFEWNLALNSRATTTGCVMVSEVARESSSVAEAQIAWGPSLIDEDVVAQMDAIRATGFQPLPGQASVSATA
jgi:hypothetical protein